MHKIITILGLAAFTSGCAGVSTYPFSSSSSILGSPNPSGPGLHNQTDIRLNGANFAVVKTNVVGQCNGFALLGFITVVPARFQTAMNRLYVQAEMQPGKPQTLAYLTMERSSAYWILFSVPRVSVRADVVEFVPEADIQIIPLPGDDAKPAPGTNATTPGEIRERLRL